LEAGLHPDPLSRRSLAAVGDGRQGRGRELWEKRIPPKSRSVE